MVLDWNRQAYDYYNAYGDYQDESAPTGVDPENWVFRTFGDNSGKAHYWSVNWDRIDGPQARQTLPSLLSARIFSSIHQMCGRARKLDR